MSSSRSNTTREPDNIENLVSVICADLPLGMSRLDAVRFKNRTDSLIRGFVLSAKAELETAVQTLTKSRDWYQAEYQRLEQAQNVRAEKAEDLLRTNLAAKRASEANDCIADIERLFKRRPIGDE